VLRAALPAFQDLAGIPYDASMWSGLFNSLTAVLVVFTLMPQIKVRFGAIRGMAFLRLQGILDRCCGDPGVGSGALWPVDRAAVGLCRAGSDDLHRKFTRVLVAAITGCDSGFEERYTVPHIAGDGEM